MDGHDDRSGKSGWDSMGRADQPCTRRFLGRAIRPFWSNCLAATESSSGRDFASSQLAGYVRRPGYPPVPVIRLNIEQRLAESIRSFGLGSLAGAVPLNIDLDLVLTVLANTVCAAMRRRLPGYANHHPRHPATTGSCKPAAKSSTTTTRSPSDSTDGPTHPYSAKPNPPPSPSQVLASGQQDGGRGDEHSGGRRCSGPADALTWSPPTTTTRRWGGRRRPPAAGVDDDDHPPLG